MFSLYLVVLKDDSTRLKKADISLAVHIASHTNIQSIGHLGEMLSELGNGSVLQDLRLHRTKCSSLILNVIAPALSLEIVAEIGNAPYSIF